MSAIFMDSVDHYATADILSKWDANAGFSVSASGGRCNTAGFAYDGSAGGGLKKNIPSAATYIIGFGLFVPAFTLDVVLASFMENTTRHVDIVLLADGRIRARRAGSVTLGTSTSFLTAGAYNYVEIKITISDTVGVVTVRVNGTSTGWLALTSQDTQNGGTSAITNIILGGELTVATPLQSPVRYDDIVILDTAGSVNNDFLGDCRVEAIFPNGAGNYAQWTPSTGSNFQNVDEAQPNGDTDYNSSSTANQIDTFAYSNLSVSSGTVKAVAPNMWARKDDAGSRSIAAVARLSAVDATGSTILIGNTFADYQGIFETKPGGGAWSITDVNNSEFGYKLIA